MKKLKDGIMAITVYLSLSFAYLWVFVEPFITFK